MKRTSLVRSLGSDHLPLVVDFGLVTPLRKTSMPTTAATAAVPAPVPENASAICSKSDVLEAVRQLESQVSNLKTHLSRPQMPQPAKECPGLLPELRLFLYASTCASMLMAASVLHLGFPSSTSLYFDLLPFAITDPMSKRREHLFSGCIYRFGLGDDLSINAGFASFRIVQPAVLKWCGPVQRSTVSLQYSREKPARSPWCPTGVPGVQLKGFHSQASSLMSFSLI